MYQLYYTIWCRDKDFYVFVKVSINGAELIKHIFHENTLISFIHIKLKQCVKRRLFKSKTKYPFSSLFSLSVFMRYTEMCSIPQVM